VGLQAKPEPVAPAAPAQAGSLDRTVLPIQEPKYPAITELDAGRPPAAPLRGEGARGRPNVLIVLIDDMGFGMSSAFGGRFTCRRSTAWPRGTALQPVHTTALCSPDAHGAAQRRNHHTNNMGGITETATRFRQHGQRPDSVAPLTECCA